MADFRKRKTRLQDDLELLEGSLENRFNKAKTSVLGSFNPIETIRKKPLQAVAVSVAAGLVLGLSGKKKRRKSRESDQYAESSSSGSSGFTSLFIDEVKRIAARRAASYLSELMDERMMNR